jgi:hypothetical protein
MARKAAKRLKNQGENQIEDQQYCGWAAVGDPKTLFWPKIKSIAEIGIRSSTEPTTCNRRLGMRVFASGVQSSGRFAVITEKSKELAAFSYPLGVAARNDVVCTRPLRLLGFRFARSKWRDFTAPRVREFKPHMP